MTSVLIIDDHPIVLQGCRRILEDVGVQTVLDARDVASGYRLYRRHQPDVVIIDLAMQGSGLGGLPLIRRIRSHDPRTPILVLSMHRDPILVARALRAGPTGYDLKDTSPAQLVKAFEHVRAIDRLLISLPSVCFSTGRKASSLGCGREQLHGDADEIGQVSRAQFLLDLRAGIDHGLVADLELLGDLAIGFAFGQQ